MENEHERIVTRSGRPAAALVSPDDLAAIEETLDRLSDAQAHEEIRQARAEVQKGQVVGAEALREKYLGR